MAMPEYKAVAGRPVVFISHSTGDLRDSALAHGIADRLTSMGAGVWIAPESLPAGSEWERELIAAVLGDCTDFLVILSAASTASQWVSTEIELAFARRSADARFRILPLPVGKLGDYSTRQQIEQLQALPYHDSLDAQVQELAKALGLPSTGRGRERPSGGFVGREFVFEAIDRFLESHSRGCFTIVGDPGEGKTTILSEYVRRTGCIAHFNVMNEQVSRPDQFLKSVHAQIAARFQLPSSSHSADSAAWSNRLDEQLERAAARLAPGQRLVIAVDALDEVDMSGYPASVNILFLPRRLPERTFLILTRRRAEVRFVNTSPQTVFDLIDHPDQCMDDIRLYIRSQLKPAVLTQWGEAQDLAYDKAVEQLADKSERNFMYLSYVLPEIESGAYRNLTMIDIPSGLQGYYEDHWERMGMKANPLPAAKIRIVYILGELRRPVSRRLIADFARQDALSVQAVLDEWEQFLHRQPQDNTVLYSIYHMSFLEFLHRKDIVQAAGESIEGIHDLIQDRLWAELMGGQDPGTSAPGRGDA